MRTKKITATALCATTLATLATSHVSANEMPQGTQMSGMNSMVIAAESMRQNVYTNMKAQGYDVTGLQDYLDADTTTEAQFWEAAKKIKQLREGVMREKKYTELKAQGLDVSSIKDFLDPFKTTDAQFWDAVKKVMESRNITELKKKAEELAAKGYDVTQLKEYASAGNQEKFWAEAKRLMNDGGNNVPPPPMPCGREGTVTASDVSMQGTRCLPPVDYSRQEPRRDESRQDQRPEQRQEPRRDETKPQQMQPGQAQGAARSVAVKLRSLSQKTQTALEKKVDSIPLESRQAFVEKVIAKVDTLLAKAGTTETKLVKQLKDIRDVLAAKLSELTQDQDESALLQKVLD